MRVLIAYDVNTSSPLGRRRYRRLKRICEQYALRRQFSVYEGKLSYATARRLVIELRGIINPCLDRLIFGCFHAEVWQRGQDSPGTIDFDNSLWTIR